ncbi:hypothetical protein GCM10027615_04110 [Plantactinospora veratri]
MTLDLPALLPPAWRAALDPHLDPAQTAALGEFVAGEYATQTVFPRWTISSRPTGSARRRTAGC